MNLQGMLLMLAEEEAEYVNITPTLLKFAAKFFIVFAVIAIVGILTPWMAKKVDAMRAKHADRLKQYEGDPREKAVRGIYDGTPPAGENAESSDGSDQA